MIHTEKIIKQHSELLVWDSTFYLYTVFKNQLIHSKEQSKANATGKATERSRYLANQFERHVDLKPLEKIDELIE